MTSCCALAANEMQASIGTSAARSNPECLVTISRIL
jgi:hypothetical protein